MRAAGDLLTVVDKRPGLWGEMTWAFIPALLFSSYVILGILPVRLSSFFNMGVKLGGCEDSVRSCMPSTC